MGSGTDGKIKELFGLYQDVDEEKIFANLKYFLEAIMPVCDKYDINMAIHPDDPAWSVFGLPRIITNLPNIQRMIQYFCEWKTCAGRADANAFRCETRKASLVLI